MEIESNSTLDRCLLEGINIFTGAGFSVLAQDNNGKPLPIGDQLRDEILEIFPKAPKTLQLPQLCTFVSRTRKDELDEYIRNRFHVGAFSDKYLNLGFINPKFVFTTNVDNLLETVFCGNPNKFVNNAGLHGASLRDKSAIDYIALHGCVTDVESNLVFGDLDIASAFTNDPAQWNYFRTLMSRYPTLFWGYSLKDAGTLQVFHDALGDCNRKNSWIIVHPEYTTNDEIEYFRSLDLKIIKSDTEDFLTYLGKFSSVSTENQIDYSNPFPEHSIPNHSGTVHRSIHDFYQGSAPTWSDIYSPRVPKLSVYSQIEEEANKGKNVLITGGPATGKTTLLMQFAAFHDFNGIKIMLGDMSIAKAKTIATKIADIPTLLFVDNFQNSIEGLNFLATKKNIQLVIAERDYAYLSSSNANFLRKNIKIIDITVLNEIDAQTVIRAIPEDMKSRNRYKMQEGDSLFELIEKNCRTKSIKERFNNVIDDLRKKDEKLVQLFLLACYLHTCRSVTSMDILYSFFCSSYNDYEAIYELISILSSSLSEYTGEYSDSVQDYFSIRSNLLADHISTIAPIKDLAIMLTTFHNNVPCVSIPSFSSYKRRAYDARLFERAFPKTNDGVEVYDVIYRKHNSPFNLQQKALYLSRRGDHQTAFKVIDDAIAKGGTRNWSIKNSYAIIKFKANIEQKDSSDVRKALDESMDALEKCHSADIRKAFHAMSYADQSLRYWKKYRDSIAISYLEKSRDWLSEEADANNRIENVSRLLRQVRNALASSQ